MALEKVLAQQTGIFLFNIYLCNVSFVCSLSIRNSYKDVIIKLLLEVFPLMGLFMNYWIVYNYIIRDVFQLLLRGVAIVG